ncbi:hypothetical protein ACLB6G_20295 [Zhengella sp. ZM62]|uniref:hypothetical protein n=1 Tax=Zhengella sedimenti TaxID=3390035 RepID=UPI0039767DB2
MAAGTFTLYDHVAEIIGDGSIDLDNDTFKIALVTSSYTPSAAHTTWSQVSSNEVADGNGYTTGGASLASVTWAQTSGAAKFDSNDQVWTASGGSIAARYAVIYDDTSATDLLLGYLLLDTTPADLTATDGNTLTVGPDASNGWFTLTVNA